MAIDSRLGFIGILYRSHDALIGEKLLTHLNEVKLVVVANDISSNQAKSSLRSIESRHIPTVFGPSSLELGKAVGHEIVNFVGITSKKAASSYLEKTMKGAKKHEEN